MNHFRFPLGLLAFTLLLTSATFSAKAQGQQFQSQADWLAEISGEVSDVSDSLTILDDGTACVEVDPTLGQFEGFLYQTGAFFPPTILLFDGDTLVETVELINGSFFIGNPGGGYNHGWINTDGLNLTKIVIVSSTSFNVTSNGFFLSTIPEPVLPAEVIISILIDNIKELIESNDIGRGEGKPIQNFLKQALKNLNKGKIDKAINKLNDAHERVLELIENGSLSAGEGEAIIDMIDSAISDVLDEDDDVFDCSEC